MITLFWLSSFLIFYIFIGYPLILLVLAKLVPNKTPCLTVDIEDDLPSVEVILVVRNVADLIVDKLDSLQALEYPKNKLKIIVISDNSEDDTVAVILKQKIAHLRCIDNSFKSSKSACLNQAIAISDAEILFLTDARQSHDSLSLKHLVKHFSDKLVGAVSGELVLTNSKSNDFARDVDIYWRYEKMIRANESKIASVPGVTGAVYAMRREFYTPIPDQTLLDDVLIPMNLILDGKRVLFDSRALAYDIPSSDILREKIRKTRTLAGNWQLLELKPSLLNPFKNSIWFQFVSHKILRLFAPLLLLMVFISTFLLSSQLEYFLLFVAQLFGYTLVLAAHFFPLLLKIPLIKPFKSFLTMMWFTVLGFWAFFTRQHLHLWK